MQTTNNQKKIFYKNLESLKNSYKLQAPKEQQWRTLSNGLKIQQTVNVQASISNHSQQTWSEELSYNGFAKTKQLFKHKNNNSIFQDDFTNQHIYSAQKTCNKNINFQFDSFGRQENLFDKPIAPLHNPNSFSSNEIKDWNSSSLQINFNKVPKYQLRLPDPKQTQIIQKDSMCFQKTVNQDSQVRQFQYRLSDSSEVDLQKTPVKKWSESKIKTEAKRKKELIKVIIMDFMQKLERIPAEQITYNFIEQTKNLFQNMSNKTERAPFLQSKILKFENKQKNKFKTIEQSSSSTIRLHTQNSCNKHICKQKDQISNKKNEKFKIYSSNNRNKQNTENKNRTPIKNESKTNAKQKRFRF